MLRQTLKMWRSCGGWWLRVVDVNVQCGWQTALHVAAISGRVGALRVLVELGANKEAKAIHGRRPLHLAAQQGQVEVISTLVELGAELEARTADGQTPLQICIDMGRHPQAERVLRQLLRTRNAAAQHAPVVTEPTAAASQITECAACGNTSGTSGAALKMCARCRSVKYCSVACQRRHWSVHKRRCAAAPEGPASKAAGGVGAAGTVHLSEL
jgi:ankyrin repeat protein